MIDMITSWNKKKKKSYPNYFTTANAIQIKQKICDKLNEYFVNVGPTLASKLPSDPNLLEPTSYIKQNSQQSFMFRAICTEEVSDFIQGLKTSKASIGPPIIRIKLANQQISTALALVFNNSLVQGIMPNILKLSRVTPVHKSGDSTEPENYRPISTLSSFTQILEKLVYKQMMSYIEKQKILNDCQFGFQKVHSTEQALYNWNN